MSSPSRRPPRPRAASRIAVLALIATALFCTSTARAQSHSHILSLGFGGGVTVPTGAYKDAVKSGFNGQTYVLVHLGPLPALRFNLAFQKFNYKDALGLTGGGTSAILSGTGGLQINLLRGPVRPYITAGLGAFDVRSTVDSVSGTTQSKVNFGIDGGAGLAFTLGRHIDAFIEGKVQNVYTRNGGFTSSKSIQTVPVTFGILFGL
jgi:hypothetical protein